jgi:signal transduction histidine kinase
VRHALEIVRNEMQDRQLQVDLKFEAAFHDCMMDGPRMQQVFWNLLRNAYKFSPLNGRIEIRSSNPRPDIVRLEVSDEGVGIQSENLQRIFDAFEQVDRHREGLGLGLAISKAIVEMHRGSISAQSAGMGKGATFVVELPVAGGEPD